MIRYVIFTCLILLLLIAQFHNIFSVGGISPNIILVAMLAASLSGIGTLIVVFALVLILGVGMLLGPFWLPELLIFVSIIIAAKLLVRPITGNGYVDFIIIVAIATILFNLMIGIILAFPMDVLSMFKEVIYNGLITIISWPLINWIIKSEKM